MATTTLQYSFFILSLHQCTLRFLCGDCRSFPFYSLVKSTFLFSKGLLYLCDKQYNSGFLVNVELPFSCSTRHLTRELSSGTLEGKFHIYVRPCYFLLRPALVFTTRATQFRWRIARGILSHASKCDVTGFLPKTSKTWRSSYQVCEVYLEIITSIRYKEYN